MIKQLTGQDIKIAKKHKNMLNLTGKQKNRNLKNKTFSPTDRSQSKRLLTSSVSEGTLLYRELIKILEAGIYFLKAT